jgi:anti-sigma regulatory factor (Ser/Thr protein kinase)
LRALASQAGLQPSKLDKAAGDNTSRSDEGADAAVLAGGEAEATFDAVLLPARLGQLERATGFVHEVLERWDCPPGTQYKIDICLEELFVNVASYAYPDATEGEPGTARVSYSYSATPPSITIKLADDGIPFDPLAVPDENIPAGADPLELRIGGLGILMAQKSVDEMFYDRVDDSNVVTLVKRW